MERRLDKTRLCALLIDATPFEGQQMVAALGIGEDGRKTILGIRQGATENATVVGELLGDLVERGLDFSQPRLYVLDGGKALTAAVKKHAGESAMIQRCQVHKRRNVLDHLSDEQKPGVTKRLNAAYALEDYAAAKQALNMLHRELMDLNPSAARSLGEGMEETLTVHKLHLPMQLRRTMASTNVIESLEGHDHIGHGLDGILDRPHRLLGGLPEVGGLVVLRLHFEQEVRERLQAVAVLERVIGGVHGVVGRPGSRVVHDVVPPRPTGTEGRVAR